MQRYHRRQERASKFPNKRAGRNRHAGNVSPYRGASFRRDRRLAQLESGFTIPKPPTPTPAVSYSAIHILTPNAHTGIAVLTLSPYRALATRQEAIVPASTAMSFDGLSLFILGRHCSPINTRRSICGRLTATLWDGHSGRHPRT